MRGEKTERELHCLKVIGDNIKAARKHRGLSQRDLAKKLDVSQTMVSYWEAGKGAPDGYDLYPEGRKFESCLCDHMAA